LNITNTSALSVVLFRGCIVVGCVAFPDIAHISSFKKKVVSSIRHISTSPCSWISCCTGIGVVVVYLVHSLYLVQYSACVRSCFLVFCLYVIRRLYFVLELDGCNGVGSTDDLKSTKTILLPSKYLRLLGSHLLEESGIWWGRTCLILHHWVGIRPALWLGYAGFGCFRCPAILHIFNHVCGNVSV